MERVQGLSFCQDTIKYITIEIHKKKWVLENYGEILRRTDNDIYDGNQWSKQCHADFNKVKFRKNKAYITLEADHTYLNMKKINTITKTNYQDVIKYNYKNTLPILFEKDRYKLEHTINRSEKNKTTEIAFWGIPRKNITAVHNLTSSLGVKPKTVKPSYQFFVDLQKSLSIHKYNTEYELYVESSNNYLTFILIHENTPILKRSIELNKNPTVDIQNFFYYLKHYLMIEEISVFIGCIKEDLETTLLLIYREYYDGTNRRINELLHELPCYQEINPEIIKDFQNCFLAINSLLFNK